MADPFDKGMAALAARLKAVVLASAELFMDNVAQIAAGTKRLAVVQSTMKNGDIVYEVRLRDAQNMVPEEGSAEEVKAALIQVKERFGVERAKAIIRATGYEDLAELVTAPEFWPTVLWFCRKALSPPPFVPDITELDDLPGSDDV